MTLRGGWKRTSLDLVCELKRALSRFISSSSALLPVRYTLLLLGLFVSCGAIMVMLLSLLKSLLLIGN